MDSLMIQPCNPSRASFSSLSLKLFRRSRCAHCAAQDVRSAIMQADETRYNGQNRCLIWIAFASRGLGVGSADFKDTFNVPQDCQSAPPPPTPTPSPSRTTTEPLTTTQQTSTHSPPIVTETPLPPVQCPNWYVSPSVVTLYLI